MSTHVDVDVTGSTVTVDSPGVAVGVPGPPGTGTPGPPGAAGQDSSTLAGQAQAAAARCQAVTTGALAEPFRDVTVGALADFDNVASTVPNATLVTVWDQGKAQQRPCYRALGCRLIDGGGPGGVARVDLTCLTYAPGSIVGPAAAVETEYTGTRVDVAIRQNGVGAAGKHRVYIDGRLLTTVSDADMAAIGISPGYFARLPLTFVGTRPRRIGYESVASGAYFYGLTLDSTIPAMCPTATRGPRVAFVGDSFTEGTGTTNGYAWWWWTARDLGWRDAFRLGSGSTGYYAGSDHGTPGAARPSLVSRYQNDVIAHNPNIIVFAVGINDAGSLLADIVTAATTVWDGCVAALPKAQVNVVGPWPSGGGTGVSQELKDLDAALLQQARTRHLRYISPIAEGWTFSRSDTTHPDDAGHETLGHRVAGHLSLPVAV